MTLRTNLTTDQRIGIISGTGTSLSKTKTFNDRGRYNFIDKYRFKDRLMIKSNYINARLIKGYTFRAEKWGSTSSLFPSKLYTPTARSNLNFKEEFNKVQLQG